ncbi:MAG: transcription termination/antitermination protein NusG [Candidatus Geothermincolia bacterium]
MRHWYVVQSKPQQAERVAAQLEELLAIEVYNPRIEVRVVRGTRKLTQVKPLFPNYLFARLDLPEEWKTITFTRGVARVLGGWEDPRPIDESVVAAIRSQERRKDRLISYYRFKPQEFVVVRSGPFKDVHGIFDRYIDEGGRVRILLSLIGFDAAVELESEQVSKA